MKTVYRPLPQGAVRLEGFLGNVLERIICNRLMKIDYHHLVDPFRRRDETDGRWRCEFFGKIVRSAILAWRATGDKELLRLIDDAIEDILSTQTADGCISTYPEEQALLYWDIWGRKYVMLVLLRYWREVRRDERVLSACCRMADHLMGQVGKRPMNTFGRHGGLAACSILQAFVQLYDATGNQAYLDFARRIIDCGCSLGQNVFEAAERFTPPSSIGNGKTYELMACFEGLAEYNAVSPEPVHPTATANFFYLMRNHEIFITGTGGLKDTSGEFNYDGRFKQTRNDAGALGETCVTATYLRYCAHLLMLEGGDFTGDELERSFVNAAPGAVKNDGSWFCHVNPTPLSDFAPKQPASFQLKYLNFGEDCCVAQGPESIALAPYLAVLESDDGYLVNLYEDMTVRGLFRITGGYPFAPSVRMEMLLPEPRTFTLKLRIPEWWNDKCALSVCGEPASAVPGRLCKIRREWRRGDIVFLSFDLSVRRIEAPGDPSREAFMSGPVVLAESSRLPHSEFPLPKDAVFTDKPARDGVQCIKEVSGGGCFCDYASAGNMFTDDDRLMVWFPRLR